MVRRVDSRWVWLEVGVVNWLIVRWVWLVVDQLGVG